MINIIVEDYDYLDNNIYYKELRRVGARMYSATSLNDHEWTNVLLDKSDLVRSGYKLISKDTDSGLTKWSNGKYVITKSSSGYVSIVETLKSNGGI